MIKAPTHFTPNSSSLLDIIATTSSDLVKRAEVEGPSLSNHCDVTALVSLNKPHAERFRRKIYNYELADWEKMKTLVRQENWEPILTLAT
jgi:hypothetical protein